MGQRCVPRYAFILWLVYKRRLSTKDRLQRWGIQLGNLKCELCGNAYETTDHLLFECEISAKVKEVLQRLCLENRTTCQLEEELNWACSHSITDSFEDKIKRLAFAATVYELWRARNQAVFQDQINSNISIVKTIVSNVRAAVYTREKIPPSRRNWEIVMRWDIPQCCFSDARRARSE